MDISFHHLPAARDSRARQRARGRRPRSRRRSSLPVGARLAVLIGLLFLTLVGCGAASAPVPAAPTRTPRLFTPAPTTATPVSVTPTPESTASTPVPASAPPADVPRSTAASALPSPTPRPVAQRREQRVTKVLTIVEENHSLAQMRAGMPYLAGLAERFGYADHYTAARHPSLPNYLAIAGGDTFGVADDDPPAQHVLHGPSVFSQARDVGLTAQTWAESMSKSCRLTPDKGNRYAVKHNPWTYFADDRTSCEVGDVGTGFVEAATANALPNVGMLIPNTCHDAHDGGQRCGLAAADDALRGWLEPVLASRDFTSGALVVVITADEDDLHSANRVLTVVLHAHLDGSAVVVSTPLTHYSLSRLYSEVIGAPPLRKAADAPDLAAAFHLPLAA